MIAQVEPTAARCDSLAALVARLQSARGLLGKQEIQLASRVFPRRSVAAQGEVINGDDAAAIPDGDGYCLIAAEGMLPSFAEADPWFAGFCAVMVNVSDIAAMGGRALAIVDVLFAGDLVDNERILTGMQDASETFGVPVVGGHTTSVAGPSVLAAAIVGRARQLITSFGARPGDDLLYAVDLEGAYRGALNFNAATHSGSARLRANVALLPAIAEAGLASGGKDVSMGGLLGTLAMLCEGSGCGAEVDLSSVPRPADGDLERWLLSFPSYGYLLSARPSDSERLRETFAARGIACAKIGECRRTPSSRVGYDGEVVEYRSTLEPLTGYGSAAAAKGTAGRGAP